jgi:4-amino-4-deoxy-L-arabinose transferase-like glycosyltransferase
MLEKIIERLKKTPKHIWMLIAIIAVGIFLRTYHFHDWLEFRGDQVRDAYLVDDVISGKSSWPIMGPFLSHTAVTEEASFHMGPIYYYFQITSAKIFGGYPDKMAYPDLFFSILSIPLFYLFLRIYFQKNLSLGLTGLYSISAYIIRYSRYAWSCNSIPFFVLLMLISLFKLLESGKKTSWKWIFALGFAWGVGFQLHAITMIVFSGMAFIIFIFLIKKDFAIWRKIAAILLVFLILNSSQIVNEIKTGFSNVKALINSFSYEKSSGNKEGSGAFNLIKNAADCHIEANFLYLSSYGSSFKRSNCQYIFLKNAYIGNIAKTYSNKSGVKIDDIIPLASLAFSIIGYILLLFYNKRELDKKRRVFFHLLVLYAVISYLLMLPLSNGETNDLRYYSFLFFVPFVLLGLIVKLLSERFPKKYILPVFLIFFLLAVSQITAISYRTSVLANKKGMDSDTAILGEMEDLINYMVARSGEEKKIYLGGDRSLLTHSFESIKYLAKKQGFDLNRFGNENDSTLIKEPIFYVEKKPEIKKGLEYKKIGTAYIYRVN